MYYIWHRQAPQPVLALILLTTIFVDALVEKQFKVFGKDNASMDFFFNTMLIVYIVPAIKSYPESLRVLHLFVFLHGKP